MATSNPSGLRSMQVLGVAGLLVAGSLAFTGCDGSSGSSTGPIGSAGGATLLSVDYGRLVDIYSYRRIDDSIVDRRDSRNRVPALMQQNTLVSSSVEGEDLFDAIGGERLSANFRFLPFDATVGHEELVILWDDRDPIESDRFQAALTEATTGLDAVPASFRSQDTSIRPIPVVPRNAAIRLNFDRPLGVNQDFFAVNPRAIQLLRFIDDPTTTSPQNAFSPVPFRILSSGSSLVLDTTLIGGEIGNGATSTGLAASDDSITANFRIAIPVAAAGNILDVEFDLIPQLNGLDSAGNTAVIRDFRSGNANDGRVGSLVDEEAPSMVGQFEMGILDVDTDNRILTINKRGNLVAIRGRIPFVDGAIVPATGLPGGRSTVPTVDANQVRQPLVSGDHIEQTVSTASGEVVTIRAQVVENMDVGTALGDATFPAPGLTAAGDDGADLAITRLRVDRVSAFDSEGRVVTMVGGIANPEGIDCLTRTRYYEFVPFSSEFGGSFAVSDASRRLQFAIIEPPPIVPAGTPISPETLRFASPSTSISFRFSEPMDLSVVSTLDNLVYTKEEVDVSNFQSSLASPKAATLNFVPSRLVDVNGDATTLRLLTPLGHFHAEGDSELYWAHVDLASVLDVSGNAVDLFDRRADGLTDVSFRSAGAVQTVSVPTPIQTFSVQFEMDPSAQDNLVASRVFRFAAGDEDGTLPGSNDLFGQFRLQDGKLTAAQTQRFSRTADRANLQGLDRFGRGECVIMNMMGNFVTTAPIAFSGFLYDTPDVSPAAAPNSFTRVFPYPTIFLTAPGIPQTQTFGGVGAPHIRRGSRMQMTYREDDLSLGYENEGEYNIDIEQMYWAPWDDMNALFDTFDNYTLLLGHSEKRPDRLFYFSVDAMPPQCELDCASYFSGLSPTFADNPLDGSEMVAVVDEAQYTVMPALSFRDPNTDVRYVPYPEFERTYTWRDSRLVSWDMSRDEPIGLGGAIDAFTPPAGTSGAIAGGDRTASVSSPWAPNDPLTSVDGVLTGLNVQQFVRDPGDFLGDKSQDHDPIALPLLVEWQVRPDTTVSSALSFNEFWMAYVGPPYVDIAFPGPTNGGYFNAVPGSGTMGDTFGRSACGALNFPSFRVHSSGGTDPVSGANFLINPPDTPVAGGGSIIDLGLGRAPDGLFNAPPGDGSIFWTQMDFVRKTSLMTFGFFDTFQPNRFDPDLQGTLPALPNDAAGRPDLMDVNLMPDDLAIDEFLVVTDPPFAPGGTSVVVEIRGVNQIGAMPDDPGIYDPIGIADEGDDNPATRGNLLNPNYACEAYRYASIGIDRPGNMMPRVAGLGLTPYVPLEQIDSIRGVNDKLPRFLNMRIVMDNNIVSNPTVSPSLNHVYIAYRMQSISGN